MSKADVMSRLEEGQDERGIKHWNKDHAEATGLTSFGIGLTRLRKMAKEIGRNHSLAMELWSASCYEAKVLALLIDEPREITKEQAEKQVEELDGGYLAHVFSSCDAPLAKAPFARELADEWMANRDPVRRRCGFGLLYEISKSKKKDAPGDPYFLRWIERIGKTYQKESATVLMAMGGALMGIGKRNEVLNQAALKVARAIGPIHFDESGKCDPMDVVKHLTSDYLRQKFAGKAGA